MSSRPAGPGLSLAMSIAVHALLAGCIALGLWQFRRPPPLQQLALEASVVEGRPDSAPPSAVTPAPAVEPDPPRVTPDPAPIEPAPPVDDGAARDQLAREQAASELATRQQQLQATREQQERQAKAAQEAKAARDAKAAKEAAAAREAKLAKEAKEAKEAKALKEAKAAQEAKQAKEAQELRERQLRELQVKEQLAKEQQAREQQAREQQARLANEAELRARMAAEERQTALQNSGLLAQYQAQIRARIERAWIRPPTAKPGLSCEVRITQIPGGEVVGVRVGSCNGDESVRQSIETAAYRASPLPLPPDPSLFDRNLLVTFKPQD